MTLYWDSSALLASLISESRSKEIHEFLETQKASQAYTSIFTPLEIESALQRRIKEQSLSLLEADKARLYAADFRHCVYLVVIDNNALDMALHLQKIYGLRPGDAVQLASARVGTSDPSQVLFLSLDKKLNDAARREGFRIVF